MNRQPRALSSKNLYKELLDKIDVGVYFVDRGRKITFWNTAAELMTGFKKEEVIGTYCHDNILNHIDEEGCKLCIEGCPLAKTMQDREERSADVYFHHRAGHRVKVSIKTFPICSDDEVVGAAEVFRKVYVNNGQKEKAEDIEYTEEEIKTLAIYDALTELPNRRYLDFNIKNKIDGYNSLGITFGMIFIDIDNFGDFNKKHGREMGDEVLRVVAATLATVLRKTDFFGRYGGEEFIGVLDLSTNDQLITVAEKIRVLVENSIIRGKNGEEYKVTVSIGGTIVKDGDDVKSILTRADEYMYISKHSGKNRVTVL